MTPKMNVETEQPSAAEIGEARAALEGARGRVFAATEGFSEVQWNYRPASGGWSAAGIVEHMVVVQELVLGPIAQALAVSPETGSADSSAIDTIVKTKVADRSRKFPGPEPLQPTGRWTPAEALQRLSANTGRLIDSLESTPGLRKHRIPSPPLKAITGGQYELMDGYQWILTVAFHTDRHTSQILEVKGEPGFPAR
jgi:DinB superfamily